MKRLILILGLLSVGRLLSSEEARVAAGGAAADDDWNFGRISSTFGYIPPMRATAVATDVQMAGKLNLLLFVGSLFREQGAGGDSVVIDVLSGDTTMRQIKTKAFNEIVKNYGERGGLYKGPKVAIEFYSPDVFDGGHLLQINEKTFESTTVDSELAKEIYYKAELAPYLDTDQKVLALVPALMVEH